MTAERLGIIGGTGLSQLHGLNVVQHETVKTPFGAPSGPLVHGDLLGYSVAFLARHGVNHSIPPHKINYRANIWAMKQSGVKNIIALAAIGGIHPDIAPQRICFPDQIIDYTWGRAHTFFEGDVVTHIDFTRPYCQVLRDKLIQAARHAGLNAYERGTYAAAQGPRLETAAEVDRLERDGCDMVGMTGMPEAALARELEICYATCAVCANRAAGRGPELSMDSIHETLTASLGQVSRVFQAVLPLL